jgi:hypothetical protein
VLRQSLDAGEWDRLLARLGDADQLKVKEAVTRAAPIKLSGSSSHAGWGRSGMAPGRQLFAARLGDANRLSDSQTSDELLVSATARYSAPTIPGGRLPGRRPVGEGQFEKGANPESLEGLAQILTAMSGNDATERVDAIRSLEKLMTGNPTDFKPRVISVFDHIVQRLADSNNKVVVSMLAMLPCIFVFFSGAWKSEVETILPGLVSALASNLASSNSQIRLGSSEVFDRLIAEVDCVILVQPLTTVVDYGNQRVKAAVLEKLLAIAPKLAQRKPALLTRLLLPTALRLLDEFKVRLCRSWHS